MCLINEKNTFCDNISETIKYKDDVLKRKKKEFRDNVQLWWKNGNLDKYIRRSLKLCSDIINIDDELSDLFNEYDTYIEYDYCYSESEEEIEKFWDECDYREYLID